MRKSTLRLIYALIALTLSAVAAGTRTHRSAPAQKAGTEQHSREYIKLEHVEFLRNASDDGDSFHVRAKGKEHIFRLYFVDTPETDMDFPDRVAEQANYFGITPQQAVHVGRMAADFTRKQLAGHPF